MTISEKIIFQQLSDLSRKPPEYNVDWWKTTRVVDRVILVYFVIIFLQWRLTHEIFIAQYTSL